MNKSQTNHSLQPSIKKAKDRLSNALALLRSEQLTGQLAVDRARAIAACASEIVDSLKVEAQQLNTNRDKP